MLNKHVTSRCICCFWPEQNHSPHSFMSQQRLDWGHDQQLNLLDDVFSKSPQNHHCHTNVPDAQNAASYELSCIQLMTPTKFAWEADNHSWGSFTEGHISISMCSIKESCFKTKIPEGPSSLDHGAFSRWCTTECTGSGCSAMQENTLLTHDNHGHFSQKVDVVVVVRAQL